MVPGERVTNLKDDETAAETLSPLTELPGPSNTSENTPYSNKKKKSKKKKEAEKSNGKENNKENDYRNEEWFCTDCNEPWVEDGEGRWIICDICSRKYHLQCSGIQYRAEEYWFLDLDDIYFACDECS